MKDKKNIDELFKEKLSNFEASPSPAVWNNIQAQLKEEKENRKVIPIWWKAAGVAALLALFITLGVSLFNNNSELAPQIVEETTEEEDSKEKTNNTLTNSKSSNTVIASEGDGNSESVDHTNDAKDLPLDKVGTKKANSTKDVIQKKASTSKDAVAVDEVLNRTKINNKLTPNNKFKEDIIIQPNMGDGVANTENPSEEGMDKNSEKTSDIIKDKDLRTKPEVNVASETNSEVKTKLDPSKNKKSILDAIEQNKIETAVTNRDNSPDNRWDVSPNFAPVYYNSLGEGSSIDPTFADNTQSGDVNFSYGVQISYNLTDKLSLRSGVSNVDLSYTTGGIELGTGPVSQALGSVDYGGRQVVLSAFDKGTLMSNSDPNDPFGNVTPKSTQGDVELIQNISYYEVPLELKYALLDNKLGVNLIGGFSTLFLGNNEVSVASADFSETLGAANNLSSVSFTTNLGIGFDYKISRKFKFNIEPMFKYQLNPYTDSSVSFRPYYLGVYTGLSFKF